LEFQYRLNLFDLSLFFTSPLYATLSTMTGPSPRRFLLALLFLNTFFLEQLDAAPFGRKKEEAQGGAHEEEQITDDIPGVPWLVEWLGKELYGAVNRPKYKFYLYMTVGKLPDEKSTVIFLSTLCNILYGVSVVAGFLLLPRNFMLLFTATTLYVGPALVLILLGLTGGVIAAFALYPVLSVSAVWMWFFLTSQLFQSIGKRYGLDRDRDGDVDALDVLYFVAQTKWGAAVGLQKLHAVLNDACTDPFREIHRRLDVIASQRGIVTTTNEQKQAPVQRPDVERSPKVDDDEVFG
jgi:hypothetical protein